MVFQPCQRHASRTNFATKAASGLEGSAIASMLSLTSVQRSFSGCRVTRGLTILVRWLVGERGPASG